MSPQRHLSNFVDTILIAYVLSGNTDIQSVKPSIIDGYKILNEKCDNIISKMKARKIKSNPPTNE